MKKISVSNLQYILNFPDKDTIYKDFSLFEAEKTLAFHRTIPEYLETPLLNLKELSKEFGVKNIFVKDESYRFGLNSFKALGGSYAIAKLISEKLNFKNDGIDFRYLSSDDVRNRVGEITFTTATDGNHGRGVAWASEKLGAKAVIYMPKGSAKSRIENIKKHGADVYVTDLNYDDTVRLACSEAQKNNWHIIQDTAWEGYDDIPTWIMQGYMTMCMEAIKQMRGEGVERPTHVFIQAGVGAMAGAVLGLLASIFGKNQPVTTIIEPTNAACIYESAKADNTKPHNVTGDLDTIMAGLACGEPNPIGWEILRRSASCFISCDDYVAANGMRILSNPVRNDKRIVAGESGAVGIGIMDLIRSEPYLTGLKKDLGVNESSTILIFNTEGATDPDNYKNIVWYGKYPDINR